MEKEKDIKDYEKMAREFGDKHPNFDFLTMTKRPEDMDFELYRLLRKVGNKTIKSYLKGRR